MDIVPPDVQALCDQVIDQATGSTTTPAPFGLYGFVAKDERSKLARYVETAVFDEFFGNSVELLDAEYGPYERSTFFFCVIDHHRRRPAGMLRIILPSSTGSKSLADLESHWHRPLDQAIAQLGDDDRLLRVWDVATIAVTHDYRRHATQGLVSLALYQALCHSVAACRVAYVVTILDLVVLDMIQQVSHQAYHPLAGAEPVSYLDSPSSLPVFCDVSSYMPYLREKDPASYELLVEGHGLEEAVAPPDWDMLFTQLSPLRPAPPQSPPR